MFFGVIASISIFVTIAAIIIGAILLVVNMFKNKSGVDFSLKTLVVAYGYLMSLITLIVFAYGLAATINGGMSYLFGYQFSYEVSQYYNYDYNKYPDMGPSDAQLQEEAVDAGWDLITYEGEKYTVDLDARKRDIITSVSLFLSCGFLFAVHQWILVQLRKDDENKSADQMFSKIYKFITLTIFSIVTVIALPTSIYQLLNYLLFGVKDLYDYARAIPGQPISTALVSVPIWLMFLNQVMKKDSAPVATLKKK